MRRFLRFFSVFFPLVVQIFSSPDAHRIKNRQNRLTKIRQFILYLRRHHRIHMPLHQTVFFQFAKLLCQHLRRHLRHQPLQTAEPQSAVCQMIQNQCFPFSPNQSQRCLNRAIIGNLVSRFIRIPPSASAALFSVFYRHQNHSHLPKSAVLFLSHQFGTIITIVAFPNILLKPFASTPIITPVRCFHKFYPPFRLKFSCSFPAEMYTH